LVRSVKVVVTYAVATAPVMPSSQTPGRLSNAISRVHKSAGARLDARPFWDRFDTMASSCRRQLRHPG
jgi:hypothetical protein